MESGEGHGGRKGRRNGRGRGNGRGSGNDGGRGNDRGRSNDRRGGNGRNLCVNSNANRFAHFNNDEGDNTSSNNNQRKYNNDSRAAPGNTQQSEIDWFDGSIRGQKPNSENENFVSENNNQKHHGRNQEPRMTHPMGFKLLREISLKEPPQLVAYLSGNNPFFLRLNDDNIQPDFFVLIVKILASIGDCDFDECTSQLLIKICNSKFLNSLGMYLMKLPNLRINDKKENYLFWNNIDDFFLNLNKFSLSIINIAPTIACEKFGTFFDIMKLCITNLQIKQSEQVDENVKWQLESLEVKLALCMEEREKKVLKEQLKLKDEPFGDFRELPVIPSVDDIIEKPRIRPIITEGAYENVSHYLDIQFRLMREDFLSPIRDGINDYLGTDRKNTGKRNQSVRLYHNVEFVRPTFNNHMIGILLDFEAGSRNAAGQRVKKSHFTNFRWERTKRFIFGSLLLFTSDNFRTIIFARVIDREIKQLREGYLTVTIERESDMDHLVFGKSYIMLESEVYFEPYYHVLRALKNKDLVDNFPFVDYIIYVKTAVCPPKYLNEDIKYDFRLKDDDMSSKQVLNINNWPTYEELGLNASQYEAFQSALLREFAVIQGPPGTGKTFVGLRIAEILLKNIKFEDTPMLVVCYTNHALDQFLEGILKFSDRIVRIGGQSKNESLQQYNLKELRKNFRTDTSINYALRDLKRESYDCMRTIGNLEKDLVLLKDPSVIVSFRTLQEYIPNLGNYFAKYYSIDHGDKIVSWLMESMNRNEVEARRAENRFQRGARDQTLDADAPQPEDESHNEINVEDFMSNILHDFNEIELHSSIGIAYSLERENDEIMKTYEKLSSGLNYKNELTNNILNQNLLTEAIIKHQFLDVCLNSDWTVSAPVTMAIPAEQLSLAQKMNLYSQWKTKIIQKLNQTIRTVEETYRKHLKRQEEFQMMYDLEFLKKFQLIGITTTGAARLQPLLKSLASPIVIVEEAAEVLESHIVVSLTEFCQHLILIGDHRQLRPSTAVYRLAKYLNLEVSLFERMVTNGMHCSTLKVQHRMRPEIAQLIAPSIYEELENHESVSLFPNVRGMTTNLFFLSHSMHEEKTDDDNASRKNYYEAEFLIRLARYIMQQGYEPQEITILTTYTGQMFYLMDKRKEYPILKNVRITVVDNFQGEESKIILLSLVRSNPEANVGFLKTENRICVALSRAKEGFYIVGNMDNLTKQSELWVKINKVLEDQHSVGTSMLLRCDIHNVFTEVSQASHFEPIAEGGCTKMCASDLPCGHVCTSVCHSTDRNHRIYRCKERCLKIICKRDHDCPLMCWMICEPCKVEVQKTLPCGHDQVAPCHIKRKDVQCQTKVEVILEACGHKAQKRCYQENSTVKCPHACEDRLPCGHNCTLLCHKRTDPDHLEFKCIKDCERKNKNCSLSHNCKKKCWEECELCFIVVNKKRTNCTHHQKTKCHIDIDTVPCNMRCKRIIPRCNHFCKKHCSETCGGCTEIVPIELVCGHIGQGPCGRNENPRYVQPVCTKLIDYTMQTPCGHNIRIPCNLSRSSVPPTEDDLLSFCKSKCNFTLQCEHKCNGDCNSCYQGRIHLPCNAKCGRTLICGDICKVPCSQACPPCTEKCNFRCVHNKCSKKCGELCVPCKEPCKWECPHLKCKNKCGELCSRKPCNEKCPKLLKCLHPCRGACGEPCLDVCQICEPSNFPTDFISLGEPFDDDAILVMLEDCGHYMDIYDLDTFIKSEDEKGQVFLKACPVCHKTIYNTRRCLDVVKENMTNDIAKIKKETFGDTIAIKQESVNLLSHVEMLRTKSEALGRASIIWHRVAVQVERKLKPFHKNRRQALSRINLEALKFIVQVLEYLRNDFQESALHPGSKWLIRQIDIISTVLSKNSENISQQLQKDIELEMQRSSFICQYIKVIENDTYKEGKRQLTILEPDKVVKKVLFNFHPFDANQAKEALTQLQKGFTSIVTREERKMIFAGMGYSKDHWYRCPNGHLYFIGECGQAMETSKCPECGEIVGGSHHALLRTNTRAFDINLNTGLDGRV